MAQQVIIPFSNQLIGQGYNTLTGESVGTALEVDSVFEDTSTDAQSASTLFEQVSTQESLLETLGVSASIDGRIGLFSGGAKMSFAEQHAVNSFSSYIAGRSFIQNAVRHGRGLRLTDAAKALLATKDMDAFKKAFGDKFVRAIFTGGEFCVIARITSVSEEHQSKLSASLHAEYNGFVNQGSFTADFEAATKETRGRTEVSVKMTQTGGQGVQLSFTGPDALAITQRLKDLPEIVHQHAAGLEVELASYDTIPIDIDTEEEREDRNIVLRDCARQKNKFLQVISDLQLSIEGNANRFFDNLPPKNERIAILTEYQNALNGLMSHAIKVSRGLLNPPQLFIATPAPTPVQLDKAAFSSKVKVPFLTGLSIGDAEQTLTSAGLVALFGFTVVPSDVQVSDRVTSVAPPEQSEVDFGAGVTLLRDVHSGDVTTNKTTFPLP